MTSIGFEEDIKPIFEPFVSCMSRVDVATEEGVFAGNLTDYETVKRLHAYILTAIRGHDPNTRTSHPMPPGEPLPAERIQTFADWVEQGMPETRSG